MTTSASTAVDMLYRSATPYALAVAVPYVVALLAVIAEVAWLASRPGADRRRTLARLATAGAMAVGAVVVGIGYSAILRWLFEVLEPARLEPAARMWSTTPALGAVAAFVAWDAAGFGYHWLGHRTRVGWAAHSPHHTGEAYDLTLGLRQTWLPVHGLAVHPLLALLGFEVRTLAVCAAISACIQVLQHTSLPVAAPAWLAAVVVTPGAHRHHHGSGGDTVNLGPVLTCWDRVAGTWRAASVVPTPTPASSAAASSNPFTIEMAGWRTLVRGTVLR